MTGPRAVARRTDPRTSWAAAASLSAADLGRAQLVVWRLLQDDGPMTDEQLVAKLLGRMSPSGARSRRSELVDLGLVRDTGQRVQLRSRRWAIVWEARYLELTLWGSQL